MKLHLGRREPAEISGKLRRTAFFLAFLFFLLSFVSGCTPEKQKSVSKTSFLLNTEVTITLYGTDDDSLIQKCFTLCKEYEDKFSRTKEGSELYKLNHRETDTASFDTMELIKTALSYSRLSDGAFDITIGSCSSLWDFRSESPSVPDPDLLEEALSHVGYEKISISGNRLSFSDNKTILDLGAIAKGYIADRLKDFLVENGVKSAIISLGGNILCVGKRPDGSDFRVGIQKPFEEQGTTLLTVGIDGWSVVTSGTYEQYFEQNGVLYHHILDPSTGYPCNNGLLSVTILSEQSVDGDALSTACFSLGLQKGMDLINSLENIYAVFVTEDGQLHYSDGFTDVFSIS